MLDPIAQEPCAAFGIANGNHNLATGGGDDRTAGEKACPQGGNRECKKCCARLLRLNLKAKDILEVGQSVIAAEPHIVAEEGEQQRIGHRLRDD